MPIYKFKCKTCDINDVKQFLYRYNDQTNHIDLKVCAASSNPVERVWGNPPESWYRSFQIRGQNE